MQAATHISTQQLFADQRARNERRARIAALLELRSDRRQRIERVIEAQRDHRRRRRS